MKSEQRIDIDPLIDFLREAFKEIKHAWENVKETTTVIFEEIFENSSKHSDVHKYNWRVPVDTSRNHQVINRKPMVSHTRNNI